MINIPVNAIFAETGKNIHLHRFIVAAEYSGKTVSKGNDGTIENTVRRRNLITSYNRIFRVTPHNIGTTFGTTFPRHIKNFFHLYLKFLLLIYFSKIHSFIQAVVSFLSLL